MKWIAALLVAHFYYLSRNVIVEARADRTFGALIVFDIPRGTTASLIRVGLDSDWNGSLSVRERTRNLSAWAEVGMRDVQLFVDGVPAICTTDTTSSLEPKLPDESPFSVAVLLECEALTSRPDQVWTLWVGTKVKSSLRILHAPEGALIAGDDFSEVEKRWRQLVLFF